MIFEIFNEDNSFEVKFIYQNKTKDSDVEPKLQKRIKSKPKISSLEKIEGDEKNFSLSQKSPAGFISLSIFDNFENKQKIGRGATSEVYKVKISKYPSKDFVLKIIDMDIIKKENYEEEEEDSCPFDIEKLKRLMSEFEALNQINHPNIIKTYGLYLGDRKNPPAILLEFCPFNLKKIIKKLDYQQKVRIINEISEGMKKIHEVGLIHRDLKPENILIDSEYHVKISDFGICTLINLDSETMSRTQFTGTMKCMAPEIINESKYYNEKIDVYSFGVVVYWILTNGVYPSIKLVDVAKGEQAQIPTEISNFWKELIQKCWSFDPNDRPSFNEISKILRKEKVKSDSDKEVMSSSEEEEEKIAYKIKFGRDEVRTIKLKKNATVNEAKIEIAKEEGDIDPNRVSIFFGGKNLKKTTIIDKLNLTNEDELQIYIQNIEEILLRNIEENYSEYDKEDDF